MLFVTLLGFYKTPNPPNFTYTFELCMLREVKTRGVEAAPAMSTCMSMQQHTNSILNNAL